MKSRRSLPRRTLVILATALIASGLVVAGIAAYKVVDPQAPAREHALQQQLVTGWQAAPRPPASSPPVRPGQDRPAVRPAADPRAGPELEVRGRGGSLAGPAVDRSWSRRRHPAARPGRQLRRRRARHHRREPVPPPEVTDGGRRGSTSRHGTRPTRTWSPARRSSGTRRSRSWPRCRARPANAQQVTADSSCRLRDHPPAAGQRGHPPAPPGGNGLGRAAARHRPVDRPGRRGGLADRLPVADARARDHLYVSGTGATSTGTLRPTRPEQHFQP